MLPTTALKVKVNGTEYDLRGPTPNLGGSGNRLGTVFAGSFDGNGLNSQVIASTTATKFENGYVVQERVASSTPHGFRLRRKDGSNAGDWRYNDANGTVELTNSVASMIVLIPGGNIVQQRNGTGAQAYELYGTYTDALNYERLKISLASSVWTIASEAAGTGTVRNISFPSGNLLVASSFGVWDVTPPATQSAKIADPTGGTTTDAEARTAINSIIDVLEAYGLSASV